MKIPQIIDVKKEKAIKVDSPKINTYKSKDLIISNPFSSERIDTEDNMISPRSNNEAILIIKDASSKETHNEKDDEIQEFYYYFLKGRNHNDRDIKPSDDLLNISTVANEFKNNREILKFKFWDFLLKLFSCTKQSERYIYKTSLYKEGEKKLNFYIDILTYIKKMQELDLLKLLLLNHNQLKMLNFLSKPAVSLIKGNQRVYANDYIDARDIFTSSKIDLSELDAQKLCDIYLSIKSKKQKNILDKKLLTLFQEQMRQITKET